MSLPQKITPETRFSKPYTGYSLFFKNIWNSERFLLNVERDEFGLRRGKECCFRFQICHGGITGVAQACKNFLTFEGRATDNEFPLHSTFIHAISLPPKMFTRPGGGWGRKGGSESPASRTAFSRLPYVCAPLPPDSHPSWCCSRLQVNQEDQKLRFNFQTVPKINIRVHSPAFVLAGGSLGPDESYYTSWPMT